MSLMTSEYRSIAGSGGSFVPIAVLRRVPRSLSRLSSACRRWRPEALRASRAGPAFARTWVTAPSTASCWLRMATRLGPCGRPAAIYATVLSRSSWNSCASVARLLTSSATLLTRSYWAALLIDVVTRSAPSRTATVVGMRISAMSRVRTRQLRRARGLPVDGAA